jgi:peptidoglycan-N-acetylglucosamine deacetylase
MTGVDQRRLSRRALFGVIGSTIIAGACGGPSGRRTQSGRQPTFAARHLSTSPTTPEVWPHQPVPTTTPVVWSRPAFRVSEVLPDAPANAVALTIDDGPNPYYTPQVLAVLRQNSVKATFSVVGIHAQQYPALVRQVLAEGHSVCNHSMTHPEPFATLSPAQITDEIASCTTAIHQATTTVPKLFRSPGGDWSPAVFETTAQRGLTPIDWDVDPRDWARPGTALIAARLLKAKPGEILLCHDGGGNRSETVRALQEVLPILRGRGLDFIPL